MRICILTLMSFLLFAASSYAQQRISFDVNVPVLSYTSATVTSNYMSVIGHNFFWSAGLEFGGYGHTVVKRYDSQDKLMNIRAPFMSIPETVERDTVSYDLKSYRNRSKGFGLSAGVGRFFNFGSVHGLRTEALFRCVFINQELNLIYRNMHHEQGVLVNERMNHPAMALSMNIYHTIRLSGRITFYNGLKIPFYFNPSGKYRPQYTEDILNGIKPQLGLGLTWLVNYKSCFVKEE